MRGRAQGVARSQRPWPVAWLAVLGVVVVLDPWAMLQAGFWLSFVAVALLMLSPRPAMVHGVALWRRASTALGRLVAEQSALDTHNRVSLMLRGMLWAQPVPIEFMLRSRIDLEEGRITVEDISR